MSHQVSAQKPSEAGLFQTGHNLTMDFSTVAAAPLQLELLSSLCLDCRHMSFCIAKSEFSILMLIMFMKTMTRVSTELS